MTDAPDTAETTVARNDDRTRYEIFVDDVNAGFAHWRIDDRGRYVFDHTVLDPAFTGRGLGKILAREALSDVARRGDVVVPECPFITKYLRGHEVAGLVIDWRDSPAGEDGERDAANPGESPA